MAKRKKRWRGSRKHVATVFWIGISILLLMCFVPRLFGDIIAPIRLILFGPRYAVALPIVALAAIAGLTKSKVHAAILFSVSILCIWAITDFRFGSRNISSLASDIAVLTLNVEVKSENHDLVYDLIEKHRPDFVALQETASDSYIMPPDYARYRYGELTFGTRHQVVGTPETRHAFRGGISDLVVLSKPLSPSQFVSAVRFAEAQSDHKLELEMSSISPTPTHSESTGTRVELPHRLADGFTIAMKVAPAKSALQTEFLLDYGNPFLGGNIHRHGDQLVLGVWNRDDEHWLETKFTTNAVSEVTLTVSAATADLYIDRKLVGSVPTKSSALPKTFTVGTFSEWTRTKVDRWFPSRTISFVVDVDGEMIEFSNIHNPTPRHALSGATGEDYDWFSEKCAMVARATNSLSQNGLPRIVAGDFNLPVESRLYRDLWSDHGNAFSQVGFGMGHTKQTRHWGLSWGTRIDHILTNQFLTPVSAQVLQDVGADHRPLLAKFRIRRPTERSDE